VLSCCRKRCAAREHSSTVRARFFLAKLRFQEHDIHAGNLRLGLVISMIMCSRSPVSIAIGECSPKRLCSAMTTAMV